MSITNKICRLGGAYVPEIVAPALIELEEAWKEYKTKKIHSNKFCEILKKYAGRPSKLYFAENLGKKINSARIYLKREDLLSTGSFAINNALGHAYIAERIMGKKRIITATASGSNGLAASMAAAIFNLECVVYVGFNDAEKITLMLDKMRVFGATVILVENGDCLYKDAINEAMFDWSRSYKYSYFIPGSNFGPCPYPEMVREFNRCIGQEIKKQIQKNELRKPDYLIAPIGCGSLALGSFESYIDDKETILIGVEALKDLKNIELEKNIKNNNYNTNEARLKLGAKIGIFHGMKSYFVFDENENIGRVETRALGLQYPGYGPDIAYFMERDRVKVNATTHNEAIEAAKILISTEGVITSLESAHALAYALKLAPNIPSNSIIVVVISSNGDKDIDLYLISDK